MSGHGDVNDGQQKVGTDNCPSLSASASAFQ